MTKYYYHRISHENETAYSLLKKGYLSLGWVKFTYSGILEAARTQDRNAFDTITKEFNEEKNKARWSIWYFAQMKLEDLILVPTYGGTFSIYRVCSEAQPIIKLEEELSSFEGNWNKHRIVWNNHLLFDDKEQRLIDIGFFVRVEPVVVDVPRSYVGGKLVSCMKRRATNGDISDLSPLVEEAIIVGLENKPVTLYENVIEKLVNAMSESITTALDDKKFEKLIKWYLERSGASHVWIPAKNETGKSDGADADVVAEFDNLKYIVYVQAKWHENITSAWAVNQIDCYKNQKSEGDSSYTYATWVISAADGFSEEAVAEADNRGVRLINGKDFARMLINIGLLNINDAFNYD